MIKYESVQFETSFGTSAQLKASDLPEIAFAGKSNVGKSSLLNKILNRKSLAKVSSMPGKTVTINFFKLNCCRFVDLPGYGYAKVSRDEKLRWADLMESYFKTDRDIKLVVQLLDMRHMPTQDDLDMIDFLVQTGYNFIVVLTKCDKLNKSETAQMLESITQEVHKYANVDVIPFSSLKGTGVAQVREQIEKVLG
ncbi:MAG: YihA family ribosome biogenesis GTP-binding protein [Clostridia bacterium]|nr:YihA family ribosome biogenesis GTP-binding protein [Clostridia bacterium]